MKRRAMMLLAGMLSILLIGEMHVTSAFAAQDSDIYDLEVTEVQEETSETIVTGTYGDNLEWVYEDGVLTISGIGDMEDVSFGNTTETKKEVWKGISPKVKKVILKSGVTSIGDYAFSSDCGFGALTEIVIPDTVTRVGGDAFSGSSIEKVSFPNTITEIGGDAFARCYKLKNIVIPASVIRMLGGLDTFVGCNIDITFLGDCPAGGMTWTGYYEGQGLVATVTYPAENKTWDSKQYHGHYIETDSFFGLGDKILVDITWRAIRKDGLLQNFWDQELICSNVIAGNKPSPAATACYGNVKYQYSKTKNGTFTSKAITEPGIFYVRAVVPGTSEYATLKSEPVSYTVFDGQNALVKRLISGFRITWPEKEGANLHYLYRMDDTNSGWSVIARFDDRDLKNGRYTYDDKGLVSGRTYQYKVLSYSGENRTFRYKTRVGNALPRIKITYYKPPVIKSVANTASGIQISWKKTNGIQLYRVYRKTVDGKWKGLINTSSLTYTDKTAKKGTTYIYAVRCMSKDGKTQLSQYRSTDEIKRK